MFLGLHLLVGPGLRIQSGRECCLSACCLRFSEVSRWIGKEVTYTKSLWGACLKSDIVLDTIDLSIVLVIVLVAKFLVEGINLLNI